MINKKLNRKVTSNETKHILVKNQLNELSKKVELTSIKGHTKDSIHKYKILDGTKYFFSGILTN